MLATSLNMDTNESNKSNLLGNFSSGGQLLQTMLNSRQPREGAGQ